MDGRNFEEEHDPHSELIMEFLGKHGIYSLEEAPDELIDAAHTYAEEILNAAKK